MIKSISIKGFRGFSDKTEINLAIPNDEPGSGLTVIVGSNNSGKSSILEALKAVTRKNLSSVSFSEGKRNKESGDKVEITIFDENNNSLTLASQGIGTSEASYQSHGLSKSELSVVVIPSRRTLNPFFGKSSIDRDGLLTNDNIESNRGTNYHLFSNRVFNIDRNRKLYDETLGRVLNPLPDWKIDLSDNGQYYIKFNYGVNYHSSDGAGEGLLSVMTIVDALYDSHPGNLIVIDEPELSLHPALQKRMFQLLYEYSKDRQIVISTHSPYFIDWKSLINGGELIRIVKEDLKTKAYQLARDAIKEIAPLIQDNFNNPHILGLDAKEIFFLEDHINLFEGQEDVVYFPKILELLGAKLNGSFLGWGAGGAGNIAKILGILKSLGFKKVAVILDANQDSLKNSLSCKFSEYSFCRIPTDDIRDKKALKEKKEIKGIINSSGTKIDEVHKDAMIQLVDEINKYHSC